MIKPKTSKFFQVCEDKNIPFTIRVYSVSSLKLYTSDELPRLTMLIRSLLQAFTHSSTKPTRNIKAPVLLILLGSVAFVPQSRPPHWRLDRADWDLFMALSTPVSTLAEKPSCDKATSYFNLVLHAAANLSVPKTYGRFH